MEKIILDIDNINDLIGYWRAKKTEAADNLDKEEELIASCYVDAFQTVRVNHGLPLLGKSNG